MTVEPAPALPAQRPVSALRRARPPPSLLPERRRARARRTAQEQWVRRRRSRAPAARRCRAADLGAGPAARPAAATGMPADEQEFQVASRTSRTSCTWCCRSCATSPGRLYPPLLDEAGPRPRAARGRRAAATRRSGSTPGRAVRPGRRGRRLLRGARLPGRGVARDRPVRSIASDRGGRPARRRRPSSLLVAGVDACHAVVRPRRRPAAGRHGRGDRGGRPVAITVRIPCE